MGRVALCAAAVLVIGMWLQHVRYEDLVAAWAAFSSEHRPQ
jgi:hypothetical protein